MDWGAYDYYLYAAAALFGTFGAAVALVWVLHSERWGGWFKSLERIQPQFMNVLGVLFALILAFLANDTWTAHDSALAAVDREADALHSIVILASRLPGEDAAQVKSATQSYASAAAAEWPRLARRETSGEATAAADRLLYVLSDPQIVSEAGAATGKAGIDLALDVRDARETRLALSQTHVNPLKWAGMAFLGFLTMLSVALAHLGERRPMVKAVAIFALASAPTAVIVLITGNPFQPPGAVSPAPLAEFVASAGGQSHHVGG